MAGLIGVLGGTFDPPHLGHLILADEGRAALGLERVLWVVTAQPPHKPDEPVTPVEHRLAMVQAAIQADPGFELSRADVDRPGPYYSVGTLRWLAERMPSARFAYLMGADSLRDLPRWHQPEALVAICEALGVMRRSGVDVDLRALERQVPGLAGKVHLFEAPLIGVSAKDVRARVRRQAPYRYLVPPGVADIIARRGLYR
jgi:nicotinate-nucleotide adenylyltransferase